MTKDLQLHQKRKQWADRLMLLGWTAVLIGFILLFALPEAHFTIGVSLLMSGFLLVVIGETLFKIFQYAFKQHYLSTVLNEIFETVRYTPVRGRSSTKLRYVLLDFLKRGTRHVSHGLREEEVRKTWFVPLGEGGFFSGDYFEGKFGEVNVSGSDVKTMRRRHNQKNNKTSYETLFHGRVFRFDFNKLLDGAVFVLERYEPTSPVKLERVTMESMAFNKTFNVFATKPQTAFYVLTPHFMERLQTIEKNHPGKIGFSFQGSTLYFAIHTGKDTFGFRHFKKLDADLIETMQQDVMLLHDLVEDLQLNTRIFLPVTDEPTGEETSLGIHPNWSRDMAPDEAARSIIDAMAPVESLTPKGKKTVSLEHTDQSNAMLKQYTESLELSEEEQFEGFFKVYLKLAQLKARSAHGFDSMSASKFGCLTVIVIIIIIVFAFIFLDNFNCSVNAFTVFPNRLILF